MLLLACFSNSSTWKGRDAGKIVEWMTDTMFLHLFIVLYCAGCVSKLHCWGDRSIGGGGVSNYFLKAAEDESGLSTFSSLLCVLYKSSSATHHFIYQNKTHILFLWALASGELRSADVSKIYTSILVRPATL